jgi:TDG/mug DNA glycosylase family protein
MKKGPPGAPPKPTRAELLAAVEKTVPDVIAPGLKVLFCGINPGLWTAAVGHHFARPGNRFWPALHAGGFTPRLLAPHEERELLQWGYGITNLVARTTARADQLRQEEFAAGGKVLAAKVRRYRPRALALLGVGAYRSAFGRPGAGVGPQEECLGQTQVWVLPNPSGLNAHYPLAAIAELFAALRRQVEGRKG